MEFIGNLSRATDTSAIIKDLVKGCEGEYDVAIIFLTPNSLLNVKDIVEGISDAVSVRHFLGCTCAGIISTHEEVERQPAASIIFGKLPGVKMTPFYMTQIQLESLKNADGWHNFFDVYPNENPVILALPDPFTFDMNLFLKSANGAYPHCPVIGGLASGAMRPQENVLCIDRQYHDQGIVGLMLTGNLVVKTVVSQGCRPIGETYIITKAQGNIIYELAGKPFLKVLNDILEKSPQRDQELAQEAVFVGLAMDEYKHGYKRGDFLIRGLMGVDPKTQAGYVADYVKVGQTAQIHLRDAKTATEDLQELLSAHLNSMGMKPKGALVFSCNGRGEGLFGEKNHDIQLIQEQVGPSLPASGFFCAGEIGPIGGNNFLHGFTDSIAFFYPSEK